MAMRITGALGEIGPNDRNHAADFIFYGNRGNFPFDAWRVGGPLVGPRPIPFDSNTPRGYIGPWLCHLVEIFGFKK